MLQPTSQPCSQCADIHRVPQPKPMLGRALVKLGSEVLEHHPTSTTGQAQQESSLTSKTQSVMLLFVRGTLTASPLSLPFNSGKMRAMAVALPVLVGARLTRPDLRVGAVWRRRQGRKGKGRGRNSRPFH